MLGRFNSRGESSRNSRSGQSIHVNTDATVVSTLSIRSSEFSGGVYDVKNDDGGLTRSSSNTRVNRSHLEMLRVGNDLGKGDSGRKKRNTILCPGCKRVTHKMNRFTKKKMPLNNKDVENGRCLVCVPKRKTAETFNPNDLKDLQQEREKTSIDDYSPTPPSHSDAGPTSQPDTGPPSQPNVGPSLISETKIDLSTIGSDTSSLNNSVSNDENASERNRTINTLHTLDDLPDIVYIMRQNKNDPFVLENACGRIQKLAVDDKFLSGADSVGLINEVIESMEIFPKKENLQLKCCIAMHYFAESGGENKVALNEAFATESIIRCMEQFPKNGHIQNWAIQTLISLSDNDQGNKIGIGVQNGINLIIKAMRTHQSWEDVQQNAMKALWSLTVDTYDNCFKVMDAGGAPVMMKALNTYSSSMMDDYFIGAFWSLVCSNSMKIYERICDAGVTLCLIKIIRHHRDFVQVLEKTCAGMAQLLHNVTRETYKFVDNGGVPDIIQVMSIYRNSVVIQEASCNIIRILAKLSTKNRQIILASGGLDAVFSAIEQFPSLAESHESTSSLLVSSLS